MLKTPSLNSFQRRAGQALDDCVTDAWALHEADGVGNMFAVDSLLASDPNDADALGLTEGPLGARSITVTATDLLTTTSSVPDVLPSQITSVLVSNVTIAEGANVEIAYVSAQPVTFTGTTGTLKLDDSLAFTGQISGLAGSDAIDLADVSYGSQTQVTFLGNSTGGTLTITDGINTANILLQGDYLSSTWTLSSDGNGGTVVVDPVSANNWQTLKIGGGGQVTGIDIAPDDTMVIRCDSYGAYIWNGTQWQQLITSTSMPAAFVTPTHDSITQGVYEIRVAPSNSNIFYMEYKGYVFQSTNKGTTWTQTSFAPVTGEDANNNYKFDGQKMAIDPNNPNVVVVGTPKNGLFITTNGGASWQSVGSVPASLADSSGIYPGFSGIVFDPALGVTAGRTNTIFAASYGNGVYKSTDGGTSWSSVGGPSDVQYATVSSTGVYYAINAINTANSSLWRYQNGTWTQLYSDSNGISTVAVDPFNSNEIVTQNMGGMLRVSYDAGVTWSFLDNGGNSVVSTDIPWLNTASNNIVSGGQPWLTTASTVFDQVTPNKLWNGTGTGVYYTTNLPTANFQWNTPVVWNDQSVGIEQLCATAIIVPPGGHPVVASWDRPFFYISDPNTYPSAYAPWTGGNLREGFSIDYASSNPSFLVGLADNWGTESSGYSTDGGQTWNVFPSFPAGAASSFIGGTIAASTPTDIVWAPAGGVQPYYTLNGGASWNPITLPGVSSWSGFDWSHNFDTRTVTADRVLPNTFYLYYAGQGVFETTNGGATWTKVFSGQISPFSQYNATLASVPGQAGNLFFTGGPQSNMPSEQFYQSTNGGATWTAVPNVTEVNCFGFGAAAPGQSYPSIYIVGWVNNVYGIWQSNNDAQSWTQIGTYPNGDLDLIQTISGDPNTYGQVYVGFSGSGYAYLPAAPAGPTPTSIVESPSSGDLNAGKTVTLTLNLSGAVTVAGGTPTLTLNDVGTATYTGGSGSNALTFSYTVGAGQNTAALAATAVNLNGATVTDGSGHAANFLLTGLTQTGPQIDTTTPVISSIAESPTSGALNAGKIVIYTLTMNEVVRVNTTGGSPTLTFNDGGTATYTGGSGTSALTFSYTVLAGQNTPDLMVSAVNLNGATLLDGAGNAANLSLTGLTQGSPSIDTTPPSVTQAIASPANGTEFPGNTVTFTLAFGEMVTVTGTPTLTLNDGGTATYGSGTGTSALTYTYTVGSGDATVSALAITQANLPNGATITDGAGNAANLSGALTTFPNLSIAPLVNDQAPVVTAINATLTHNQSVAASSLFTATDPDGQAITTYALKDVTGNGHFVVNGVVQATNVEIDLTAAQLAQTTYVAGSGSDQISIRASDGTLWSAWQTATVTAPVDQAPVVTTSTQWMLRNQITALSTLFTASDPDGDPITTYAFKDPTGYGYFVINGVTQPSNTEIDLTAAQMTQSNSYFVSGTGSEQLSVRASDGTLWSSWQTVAINVAAANEKAPVVTASSLTTLPGQSFKASSLFSVSDPNGDSVVTYALKDVTGSGYFVVNGVVQATNTEIDLTAAQLARTTFVTGSATDQLSVRASDGWLWSNWQAPAVNVSSTSVINAGATLELASAYSGPISFASTTGTLKLDNSASFAGTVAGMSGQDTLDLADINFATIGNPSFSGTSAGGTLTLTDGSHTANIALLGNYIASTFAVSSDGHGGTFVVDTPATSPSLGSPHGHH